MACPKDERVNCHEKLVHKIVPHERPQEHPAADHDKIAQYFPLEFRNCSGDIASDERRVLQGRGSANVFDATYFWAAFRRSVNGLAVRSRQASCS
jgi:hypothetical protein